MSKQRIAILGGLVLLASPAIAQISPGSAADVYDANGSRVGHYIGRHFGTNSAIQFDVALEDEGETAVVLFVQGPAVVSPQWGAPGQAGIFFTSFDCSGTGYIQVSSGRPEGRSPGLRYRYTRRRFSMGDVE